MSLPWIVVGLTLLALVVIAAGLVLFTARTARGIEALLPPQGRFIDLPGARLHVIEKGTGPAVLLIHGLAGQAAHFTYGVVDELAADYRVIVVDRPGSGYSERPAEASASLGAQADVMASLLDALRVDRAVVVGHSLGGAVALAMAQRHPERVTALALVAPLTHTPKRVAAAFNGLMINQRWLRHVVGWTLALPATIAMRDRVLGTVFGPDAVPADYGTRGGGLLGVRPSHFVAASTDLAAVPEDLQGIVDRYGGMRVPVGVLYGRGDLILDPTEQGEALAAALPGAQLTLIEGGHMLPVTAPEVTARFIRQVAERAQNPATQAAA